jgi:hypothetical protein
VFPPFDPLLFALQKVRMRRVELATCLLAAACVLLAASASVVSARSVRVAINREHEDKAAGAGAGAAAAAHKSAFAEVDAALQDARRAGGAVASEFHADAGAGNYCDPNRRTDCGYVGINQQQCNNKGCCWQPTGLEGRDQDPSTVRQPALGSQDTPWCFYQVGPLPVYSLSSISPTANGYSGVLVSNDTSGASISPLALSITFDTADRVHLKIIDPNRVRWEIPQSVLPYPEVDAASFTGEDSLNYAISWTESPVSIAVTRLSDGEVLFNLTGLQFQDQFLSVTTPLGPAPRLYGIGTLAAARPRHAHSGSGCRR